MRSESEIKDLIINFGVRNERIRAVLLNGSRANSNIQPDKFQDFDITLIVNNIDSFLTDRNWIQLFGEILIYQVPEEMTLGGEIEKEKPIVFHYLMLFKDGNRIDLTLFPLDEYKSHFKWDSLTIIWLDKDNLFTSVPDPGEIDYYIKKPSEKEFADTCNEFWWVSTYVGKGLVRNQITWAKEIMETNLRPMFMKMIEWKIGTEKNFQVSIGKGGKMMFNFLEPEYSSKIIQTYADAGIENNWRSLFIMVDLFKQTSNVIASKLHFQQNDLEHHNVIVYLEHLYKGE